MESQTSTTQPIHDAGLMTAARTVWAIDPAHSNVEFGVKHMTFTTVRGRFSGVSGTITLDEQHIEHSSVEVEIDVASIDTRDEKRDTHLRSADFFDVERIPTMTFKSTRVEPTQSGELRVVGDLTIRGVTREVVLDTTMTGRGTNPFGVEVAGFEATTRINRKDFGLMWNVALETGGFLVGDEIKITIDIEAAKQS
jgi:polyisoprenoid-binding protein YceI